MNNSTLTVMAALLLIIDALLVLAFVAIILGADIHPVFYRLLDLDAEGTIPSWFSSSQLLLIGVLFLVAARDPALGYPNAMFYVLCGLLFAFLSADEASGIHESVTVMLRGYDFLPRFSGDHGMWIPLYAILGFVFIVLTAKSWLRLWRVRRRHLIVFMIGAGLFVLGGVVLEIVSYGELRDPQNRRLYQFQVILEEAFELAGVSVMLIGTAGLCLKGTRT